MGSKYTSQTQSGYNASPPPDDGSVQASNKVSWSTMVKAKIGDPVLALAQAINSALVTFTNFGSRAVTATDSVAAADHMKTIEASGTFTESLPDAAATGAGFIVTVKNIGTGVITVALTTAADTLDTTVNGTLKLPQKCVARFKINDAATGYIIDSYSTEYSDSYTPTIGDTNNITSSTARVTGYSRVGNSVTLAGGALLNLTSTGDTYFSITLPVGGNFVNTFDAGGQISVAGTTFSDAGSGAGIVSSAKILFRYFASVSGVQAVSFSATYQVL